MTRFWDHASSVSGGGHATKIGRRFCAYLVMLAISATAAGAQAPNFQQTLRDAQSKIVKIYGAGGFRQLEAYQTGILISPEGHILTAWSYVLDTDDVAVVLDDGRKWNAEFVGSDPVLELALLKLPVDDQVLPYFDLHDSRSLQPVEGQPVLALSNLYGIASGDESVSVLQGVVTAIAPLEARRGSFQTSYRDDVYVLDAYTNNPGAAGGALVDWQGRLLGVLGKELRSQVTGTWLNYALPVPKIVDAVDDLKAGRSLPDDPLSQRPSQPLTAGDLGLALVPDVLRRTPPFVDAVRRDSAADEAGLRPDDLVVFAFGVPIDSRRALVEVLARHERAEEAPIAVLRDGTLIEFSLRAIPTSPADRDNTSDASESPTDLP